MKNKSYDANYTSFSTVSFYKRITHEPSRPTLAPSSLYRLSQITLLASFKYLFASCSATTKPLGKEPK